MGIKRRYAVVRASMMGVVASTRAQTGSIVEAGDTLVSIEIMKMLHDVKAPMRGEVELMVKAGEMVVDGQMVAKIFV